MLFVRRTAPEGSRFTDGDRASGVFGVIATGFAVLLGFIVFLAFTSYDRTKAGAETEALMVGQQFETAQLLPTPASATLSGQLVCYGRYVVHDEWPRMRAGTIGNYVNPWGVAMFKTLKAVEPKTASAQSAYDQWLGQNAQREEARLDRIHGSVGVIPTPLWYVLFFIGGIIFVYMLFFADPAEGRVPQSMLMGGVVASVTALLLLLAVLDRPFHAGAGSVTPVAMERTLDLVDQAFSAIAVNVLLPCDATGKRAGG